ncbi:desulfoferrodoxin family protein [Methanocella arvoryzae]|nr:desulfoferrodoxin family protein [Methanocella arvoryzae]
MGWKWILLPCLALVLLLAASGIASADRAEVDVDAPDTARPGETVQVKLNVHHEDSAPGHYVDSVKLYDGDRLLKEWTYDNSNFERAEEWSVTYTGSFDRDVNLRAVVNCNLHGGEPDTEVIIVR